MKKVSIFVVVSLILCMFFTAQQVLAQAGQAGTQQETQGTQPGVTPTEPKTQAEDQQAAPGTKPTQVDEEVVGKTVVNQEGKDLGKVKEVVAGPEGQIKYIILSHGGFLGMGAESVPIPWEAVKQGAQEGQLLVNIDEAKLANAPKFKGDERPNFEDPEWEKQVHSYYGVEPGQATPGQ